MRTTARRTAAVLMVALVAMLLVATGGSARAASHRVSASGGQAAVAHHLGRHTTLSVESTHDKPGLHLDLASTPPGSTQLSGERASHAPGSTDTARLTADAVTPLGRAPPAL